MLHSSRLPLLLLGGARVSLELMAPLQPQPPPPPALPSPSLSFLSSSSVPPFSVVMGSSTNAWPTLPPSRRGGGEVRDRVF